ncbi:MAG: FAD-dependent oxidoreductase, partial [Acidobacteriota bacterium]|nr:FAD-dependent oxidoreductase [Acidobacteriota bacterium]
ESLGEAFESDLVRGVVLTDGLVGTFSRSDDPSLVQNRCFLYHVVGNGTGEWRVPVGGMGALTDALATAAAGAGAELRTRTEVVRIDADGRRAEVELADGTRHPVAAVLSGAAPSVLERLLGRPRVEDPAVGAQVKVNMVVERLPHLRAGVDPVTAFTGTLHVNEGHGGLDAAWAAASGGALPEPVPCEVYCHSLTDDTVLGPELRRSGAHTLSLFSLQTPPSVIGAGPAGKEAAGRGCLDSLQSVLAEPLEDVLLRTPDGAACVDAHTPSDLEEALGLPGGNIFHGSLRWPWAEEAGEVGRWGTETDLANVFLCGAGARRGGGVSGIGGHNAAMAALGLLGALAD